MNRRRLSLALTAVMLEYLALATPLAAAADRHVAPAGNDESGTGASAAPWQTIGRALAAAQPGDVVVLHNGEYAESVRIRQPNITLMSAANEWAVIRSEIGTGDDPKLCVMFDVDASGGALKRLELIGGYYCVFLQTRWDWGGPDRGGASDILIEDCKIHESGRDCVKITPNSDRVTFRRCEIYNSGQIYPPGTPLDDKNAEGIDSTNGDAVVVQDCYVHDTATTGIYFKGGATDCVVERTRVERCGAAGILIGFDTSPEFFDLDANPGYYEAVNGVVRNCIIKGTNYAGIGFYAANGGLAANNTIIDTAKIGHSPIYFGITLQDWWPPAGRPASKDIRVVNNIVVQPAAASAAAVYIRYLYEPELGALAALEGMPAMSNNLYFIAGGAPRFSDARLGSALENGDLAGWQTHIGGDASSLIADPLLAADGRLTDTSPAIGNGTAVAGVSDDFDGETRSATAMDIGADQFAAAPLDDGDNGNANVNENGNGNVNANANGNDHANANESENANPNENENGDGNGSANEDQSGNANGNGFGNEHETSSASNNQTEDGGGGTVDDDGREVPTAGSLCPLTAAASLGLSMVGLWITSRGRRNHFGLRA